LISLRGLADWNLSNIVVCRNGLDLGLLLSLLQLVSEILVGFFERLNHLICVDLHLRLSERYIGQTSYLLFELLALRLGIGHALSQLSDFNHLLLDRIFSLLVLISDLLQFLLVDCLLLNEKCLLRVHFPEETYFTAVNRPSGLNISASGAEAGE
jgi:hypothetical protein